MGFQPSVRHRTSPVSPTQQVLEALKLGILDYVEKTDVFERVFVGLSGGIDSAVTAALAVQALGPKRVVGVAMPSEYSSSGSLEDASQLASNLGIELHTIPIHTVIDAFNNTLKDQFSGLRRRCCRRKYPGPHTGDPAHGLRQ